jgi:hypothetical protein
MGWFERFLRRWCHVKEIGWEEIGEKFTRFQLLKLPWLNVYLHRLEAPNPHPYCHDHPWHFWAFVLKGGYWETLPHGNFWRGPGSILFRPARTRHNVLTPGVNWSLIFTSGRVRQWRFITERDSSCRGLP